MESVSQDTYVRDRGFVEQIEEEVGPWVRCIFMRKRCRKRRGKFGFVGGSCLGSRGGDP